MLFVKLFWNMFDFRKQHKKKTHKFWWENKADPKIRDKVLITEEEAER